MNLGVCVCLLYVYMALCEHVYGHYTVHGYKNVIL